MRGRVGGAQAARARAKTAGILRQPDERSRQPEVHERPPHAVRNGDIAYHSRWGGYQIFLFFEVSVRKLERRTDIGVVVTPPWSRDRVRL